MQNSENKKYKIRSTKLPENSENGRVGEKWRNKMKFCKKRIMAVVLQYKYMKYVCNSIFLPLVTIAGEGNGNPLQYSCLENPVDRGAWQAAVHGVTRSQTRLSNFTFTFHFHALEKEMATHSSVLAWRIPGTGEPGGLPSMGSHRVGHD